MKLDAFLKLVQDRNGGDYEEASNLFTGGVLAIFSSCTQYVFVPVYDYGSDSDESVGLPDYSWITEGDGSTGQPYVLRSVEDILGFAELVTNGNAFEGKTVELVPGQIYDFSGVEDFDGIGYGIRMASGATALVEPYKPFSGTFNGNDATIKNMTMTMEDSSANIDTAMGFFNTVYHADIKDINFENCNLSSTTYHTGTAIGFVLNSNVSGITVRNSSVRAARAGGIFGCIFYKSIGDDPIGNQSFTASYNHAYNVDCYATAINAGAITAQLLCGYEGPTNSSYFTNNTAELDAGYGISAVGAAGGLVGYASFVNTGTIRFANNALTIESKDQINAYSETPSEATAGYLIGNWPHDNMTTSGRWTNNTATVGGVTYTVLPDSNSSEPAPGEGEIYNDFAHTTD